MWFPTNSSNQGWGEATVYSRHTVRMVSLLQAFRQSEAARRKKRGGLGRAARLLLSPFSPSLVLIFFAPRFTSRSFQLSERLECAVEWYGEIAKGPGQALRRCWHLRVSLTIKFLWEKCALMLLLLVFSKPFLRNNWYTKLILVGLNGVLGHRQGAMRCFVEQKGVSRIIGESC